MDLIGPAHPAWKKQVDSDKRQWYNVSVDEKDLAYLAGIIDGEGCIALNKVMQKTYKRPGYQLRVSVNMSHKPTIEYLKNTFGGTLSSQQKARAKQTYQWTVVAKDALPVLESLLPFLRVKKEQAEKAIAFQRYRNQSSPTNRTEEEFDVEEATYIEMRKLNAKWGTEYYSMPG